MTTNGTQKSIRGNILFVLNIFVLFILLFESELVIPAWLRPVGRMHAMVLHLPIVVVLLAMCLEFFRFKVTSDARKFYDDLAKNLLFAGAILSGITVIMGIFLSQEEGYNENILFWHKWTGACVYFVSSAIYSFRDATWFKAPFAKAGAIATTLAVIIAGHFGATLTHGDNFIWQPVLALSEPDIVPVEEALVFEHVIRPVFESKCMSCHNEQKLKGELLLTDSASILKGGKTGKLVVWGEPGESLLLKRIHLPVEEKKHMPPSGKPQLTDDERDLLYHWIKSGVSFTTRVQSLPDADSFRLLATRILERQEAMEERYDFPAVAQATLDRLNSNYRVLRPVSGNSPALNVNVYNRTEYTPATLAELKDVRLQVISLDLSKMPVTDEDMQHVGRFENLRKLNLNFTEITGKGISFLQGLTQMESLSLSGTAVTYGDLQKSLAFFANLKTLAIWETALSEDEIVALQNEFKRIDIVGSSDNDQPLIKLNPPGLSNKTSVFEDSVALELFHPVKDVDIRFTIDGSEPDSISAPLFRGGMRIGKTVSIKARAFKNGWLSSDVTTLHLYRSSLKPDTTVVLTRMNRVHTANGAMTFFDHQLGTFNANSPAWANNWGGFRNNMELLLRYDTPKTVRSISLNTLIETETSIFPPESIEVWGGPSPEDLRLIARKKVPLPTVYRKPFIQLFDCEFEPQNVSCLKIIATPVLKLPAWHKNKNKGSLMLIDEILVN